METKKRSTARKPKAKSPTDSVRIVPGTHEPDWFFYPREWDSQSEKLQEEWDKLHGSIK